MRYMPILIYAILCLATIGSADAATNPDMFGVCVTVYWPDAENGGVCFDEKMASDIERMGAKWMRTEFIAGKDGKVDYKAWDEIVERATAHGIGITGLIDYTTVPGGKEKWPTPEYRAQFARTAAEIVKRYGTRIKRWEVWNEPNFADFRLDPETYAELLGAAYTAMKKADKTIVISCGGLAGAWSGNDDTAASQYLDALYAACADFKQKNGRYPFDIVSVHPYAWKKAPSEYLVSALQDNIISVLARYGEAWKPVWLTEIGWDTDPESPTKMGTDEKRNEELQAKWLTDLYDICATADRGKYGKADLVNRAFFFSYLGGGFGLRDWGKRARPAWYAYAKAATGKDIAADEASSAPASVESPGVEYIPPRNIYGAHLLEVGGSDIDKHARWAHRLVGDGGYLKCFFTGITENTQGPERRWRDLIDACYRHNMIPFVRLAGVYQGVWQKPKADAPGDYTSIAQAMKRVVAGLPRKKGTPIYIEVWNEPNLNLEWSGKANAKEYAQFFVAVSEALRSLNDPEIKILNGGLALDPGFTEEMCKAVPEFIHAFDVWATHPYPQNHPPSYNNHDGTAKHKEAAIDGYMLETAVLEKYGRKDVKVMITETGYNLGNNSYRHEGYPTIDEVRRADYIMRAFRDYWSKWPEVLAVFPFEFCDASNSGTWTQFDWVYPDSDTLEDGTPTRPHLQYTYVANMAKPLDKTACVSGKVIEETLDMPVRQAVVTAQPGNHRTQTDVFGNYMIPGLPAGEYTIAVTRSDYTSQPVEGVRVAAGQNAVLDLMVSAQGEGSIEGVVTESGTGDKLQGVEITVSPGDKTVVSDASGRYRVSGLTPGWYMLTATKKGYAESVREDVAVESGRNTNTDFLISKGSTLTGPNMVGNAGFEEADNAGIGVSWNDLDGQAHPEVFSVSTEVRYSGNASQRIKASRTGLNYVWQMTNYGSITPGKKYIVQVWAKAEDIAQSGPGAGLTASFYKNDGTPTGAAKAEKSLVGTTEWTLLKVEVEAPPESQRMQVVLGADADSGTAYFDDVYVCEAE